MIELSKCNRLIDDGFSLITVSNNKKPNFSWKRSQTIPLSKNDFLKQYLYKGGIVKKDGLELPITENVGIVTGYGGLEVIDIDLKVLSTAREQLDFWNEYLKFLEDNILDFHDKFVIVKTRSNGYHILYKTNNPGGNNKIAKLEGHQEAIIETRGVGGYVFIYERFYSEKTYSDIDFISDEDREILMQCSKIFNFIEPEDLHLKIEPKKNTGYVHSEGDISPWDDYNGKNNVLDVIGADFNIVSNLSNKYVIRRHGAKSPHSGYVYKNKDLLYLFSTGTIFPNEKALSAYSCYVYKYHFGDYSAAAKKAYEDGYGTRRKAPAPIIEVENIIKEDVGVFPIDIFPKPIQNYILECNNTLDSVVDYMGCSMVWLISTIVGNSFDVKVKNGWKEKSIVWISVVGEAGIGKTPSIDIVIRPLQKINSKLIKKYIKDCIKYEEFNALTKEEKKSAEEIKKPIKTQFIVNDITTESLIDLHQESENSIAVFKDELAGWFKDMNKYKEGSDLEFWLSTWSNKTVNVNRVTRAGSFVHSPFIPVLGGIQPNILNNMYTEEKKDNGFIDRMLLSFPDAKVESFNDKEISYEILEWYNDIIINFFNYIKNHHIIMNDEEEIQPNTLTFSDEAKNEWKRIFNKISDKQNSDFENEYMKSMYPKQKSYIPRFALLIHLFDSYVTNYKIDPFQEISKESMLKAEKLSDYFVSMAKKVKGDSLEGFSIKEYLKTNKLKPNKEKVQEIFKSMPNFNRKTVAVELNISTRSITNYINEIK